MPASHICSWKSSCFWFAGFCEWHVEIGSSSVFTDAVMYCVPQGWKSVSQIFDWSCLHQAKVSHAEEKNSVMFDSPTPSCTGIHTYPGKSSLAQHSWLAHGDKCLRDLWVYWLLWGNDRFVCCMVRVKRCQSVLRGSLGWGGLHSCIISNSLFRRACCQRRTRSRSWDKWVCCSSNGFGSMLRTRSWMYMSPDIPAHPCCSSLQLELLE